MSFQAPLWYANSDLFRDKAVQLLHQHKVHAVILDMSAVSFVDGSAVETLKELADMTKKTPGKWIVFASVNARVAAMLVRRGLHTAFGALERQLPEDSKPTEFFAPSISEAVRRANYLWASYKRITSRAHQRRTQSSV